MIPENKGKIFFDKKGRDCEYFRNFANSNNVFIYGQNFGN